MQFFLFMCSETWAGMTVFPPIAMVAWPALLLGLFSRALIERPFHWRELLVFSQFGFVVFFLVFGTVFRLQLDHIPERSWQVWVIDLAAWCQLLISLLVIWYWKGLRVPIICYCLFLLCFSMAAGFQAMMSVTNIWI